MSYCVNCGVELEKSEQRCPLCGVEVVNPAEPFDANGVRPYPKHIERLNARIDRRYTATFLSLLMLIPVFICIFTNMVTSGTISWSLYVMGGALVLFSWLLLPLLLRKRNVYACVLIDGLAAALFLLGVELITEKSWFFTLGLPLVILATAYALLIGWLSRRGNRRDLFIKLAIALASTGVLVVLIECTINFYRNVSLFPRWSEYALFPCVVLAVILLLLNKRAKLKSELKRRFYV